MLEPNTYGQATVIKHAKIYKTVYIKKKGRGGHIKYFT